RIPIAPGDMINSFAVAGSDGEVTVVDAGLSLAPARKRLVAGLAAIGAAPADVRRVVITHAHPDHAGGLRAVHTPGHSPGHTALLHEDSGVLFTGDAVMNLRGVRYAPGFLCTDPDRNRQSADHLGELDFEVAAFAHGPELRRDAKAAVRALALGHSQ